MKRYNLYYKKHITLKKGEEFCNKCSGSGLVPRSNHKKRSTLICNKCLGEGKIDWIEKAVGKRAPIINVDVEELTLKRVEGRELKGEWTI